MLGGTFLRPGGALDRKNWRLTALEARQRLMRVRIMLIMQRLVKRRAQLPGLAILLMLAGAISGTLHANQHVELNSQLLALPRNVWVKLHQPEQADWRRQAHAGVAYDTKRGTLLIFGSNTHGRDWDNSVHEFNPVTLSWETHYPAAPKSSYRADAEGRAIAGGDRLLPWAMHTYDGVVYDPMLDSLVVTALPEHNPVKREVPQATIHPTWIYDLEIREWRILENNGNPYPKAFAAGSTYDSDRDVVVSYKWGIWELGPDRDQWRNTAASFHHRLHYNVEYDSKRNVLAVFGDFRPTNDVWIYKPGPAAGNSGQWEKKSPGGDPCPRGQHFPVAFDSDNGVFLIVPDNVEHTKNEGGQTRGQSPKSSSTFVYDPGANRYTRLPKADLEPLKMNYMMIYEPRHKVFLLVTGDHSEPATVWVLRLDLSSLI